MNAPFDESVKVAADSMGIALYQRFTFQEATLFLRCPAADLQRLVDDSRLEYIQLTDNQTEFFGYQLIQYLISAIQVHPAPDLADSESDQILRANEVHELTGLSRTTIWRLERKGGFPARLPLSAGSVGWRKSEVDAWIKSR